MLKYFNEMRMLSCLLTCQTSNKCILLEDIVIIASFSITTLLVEHKICSMFGISVILYVLLEKKYALLMTKVPHIHINFIN